MSLTFASWNQIGAFLRQLVALKFNRGTPRSAFRFQLFACATASHGRTSPFTAALDVLHGPERKTTLSGDLDHNLCARAHERQAKCHAGHHEETLKSGSCPEDTDHG